MRGFAVARPGLRGASLGELRQGSDMTCQAVASHMSNLEEASCRDVESGKQSLSAGAAVPGVRARVAPGRRLGQPAEVMGPAFRMAGALLGIGQAGVGQAQQRSVRLLDQVDLDQARPTRLHVPTAWVSLAVLGS